LPNERRGVERNKNRDIVEAQTVLAQEFVNKRRSHVHNLLLVFRVHETVDAINSAVGLADTVNYLQRTGAAGNQHQALAISDEYGPPQPLLVSFEVIRRQDRNLVGPPYFMALPDGI
jgi:hypothetical protein